MISHFIDIQNRKTGKQIIDVTPSAMRILLDYHWPGNVRELENAIEHAFVLTTDEYIDIFALPVELRQFEYRSGVAGSASGPGGRSFSRKKLTKNDLLEVLEAADWNKAEAGRRLGVSRTAIWKHMKKWKIPLQRS